jgi:alkylated DNA repair protein alkB family protein 6
MMLDLESFRIKEAPSTIYYVPNFINEIEEKQLVDQIYNAPKPKWTVLSKRRLQNWGGIVTEKGMLQEQVPKWLNSYCERLGSIEGLFGEHLPNHILINEYLPNQGIMAHTDGPAYYPAVCTISLSSHIFLDYYKPLDSATNDETSLESRYIFSLLAEPRSLYILKDDMYEKYLHGIDGVDEDLFRSEKIINLNYLGNKAYEKNCVLKRSTRLSLTIRSAQNVTKLNANKLLYKKKI